MNLLPENRRKSSRREYFFRLGTVVTLALSALVLINIALLAPTYLYIQQQVQVRSQRFAALSTGTVATEQQQTAQRLAALTLHAQYLSSRGTSPSPTASIAAVLALPRPGITLTSFVFIPSQSGAGGRMNVSGVASTRETLQNYDDALGALPFVTSADLPISTYAKDSNIPFTIALTGTLTP